MTKVIKVMPYYLALTAIIITFIVGIYTELVILLVLPVFLLIALVVVIVDKMDLEDTGFPGGEHL